MFIELRRRGKDALYYAAHSFRKGKEIVKLRRYLGKNLSPAALERRKAQAAAAIAEQLKLYREIRDPLRYALSPEELGQLQTLTAKGSIRIAHLGEDQWRKFSELFSYHTNAIEGSALTQKEVTALIERGKVPPKSPADIAEARGVVEAVAFVRKTKKPFSLALMRTLHRIVFKETKPFAGRFRPRGIEVVVGDAAGNIVHRGAPSNQVEMLLKELVRWYTRNKGKYPGILLAAVVHNQFENIHPLQDGNGRVGRLLMNLILLRHGLPPVNIELGLRKEYYEVLRAYERDSNIRPAIELILKEYKRLKARLAV